MIPSKRTTQAITTLRVSKTPPRVMTISKPHINTKCLDFDVVQGTCQGW